jgi:hypothetical protein
MASSTFVSGYLIRFSSGLRALLRPARPLVQEPPLRSELFSADQIERYGKILASRHRLTPRASRDALLPRLAANENTLVEVCRGLAAAVSTNERISPAGDDSVAQQGNFVHLADDGHHHRVELRAAVNPGYAICPWLDVRYVR